MRRGNDEFAEFHGVEAGGDGTGRGISRGEGVKVLSGRKSFAPAFYANEA